jgi:hypothetical protein
MKLKVKNKPILKYFKKDNMKNIKFLIVFALLVGSAQLVFAQVGVDIDENGRPVGSTPMNTTSMGNDSAPIVNTQPEVVVDDRDIPGEQRKVESHTYYPQDLEVLQDELLNSAHASQVIEQVEAMKRIISDLNASYEEIQRENRLIRRSLNNCCSANELGLSARDAYLLQNAPNPFNGTSNIAYYVPRGLQNVQIEIHDIKGVKVASFDIEASGLDEVTLSGDRLESGTYLYYLNVDGEVVDSKVMILSK